MHPNQIVAQAIASDAKATESPLSTGTITIQLNIPAGPAGVTILFATNGTAQRTEYTLTGSGVSYDPGSGAGSILVPSGVTIGTIIVSPINDSLTESPETVNLSVAAGAGYSVAGSPAIVTITDVPPAPPAGSIATWAFDASAFPFQVPSDTGLAVLDSTGWTGEIQSFGGVTGQSYVLEGDLGNGSHIDFSCSTQGVGNLVLTFQTRGSATGFNVGTWSWSVDGTTFTTLPGVNTAAQNTSFTAKTADFSAIGALNHQPNVTFRYTLNGATSEMANNRIDNFSINAAALPGVTVSANLNSVKEGVASPIVLTLTSSAPAPAGGLSVSLLFGGTASGGTDYSLAGAATFNSSTGIATMVIPAGATSAVCQVTALNDANPIELDESITVQLIMNSNRRYVAASPSSVSLTLNDRTPYNPAWIARFPSLQPAQAEPLSDPDGDGRTNLEEFSADENPMAFDINQRPAIGTAMLPDPASGGALRRFATFTFTRRTDANSPTYAPQSSLSLSSWNSDLVFVQAISGPTPVTERATYRAVLPLAGGNGLDALFFRLRIDAAP
jgi:hypothetical protein